MSDIKYPEHICFICNTKSDSSENSILRYGEWHTNGDISVHNFCLYFVNEIEQRAENTILEDTVNGIRSGGIVGENFYGFLIKDIQACVKKIKRNKCKYCKKQGASTWCAAPKCRIVFHFDCGQQNDVQYKFYGAFDAFCSKHYDNIIDESNMGSAPNNTTRLSKEQQYCPEEDCLICVEPLGPYHKLNSIISCCKLDWYHRDCVKKVGFTQGYDMKCMSCGAETGSPKDFPGRDINIKSMPRKEYIRYLAHRGIFIPKRMAKWELEPNAYVELRDSGRVACHANKCLCEKGPDFSQKTGTWEIIKCITCGGRGIHTGCTELQEGDAFICDDCCIQNKSPDFYRTLTESLAMAEPSPQSQSESQNPTSVVDETIRYVRKEVTAYDAEWNSHKPDRAEDDPEDEWYIVDVECFEGKRKTLVLQTNGLADKIDPTKPMTDTEYNKSIKQMRKDRLSRFMETAQFRDKPIQYMPVLDQLQLIWDKEDEQKKKVMTDAAQNEAESKDN